MDVVIRYRFTYEFCENFNLRGAKKNSRGVEKSCKSSLARPGSGVILIIREVDDSQKRYWGRPY